MHVFLLHNMVPQTQRQVEIPCRTLSSWINIYINPYMCNCSCVTPKQWIAGQTVRRWASGMTGPDSQSMISLQRQQPQETAWLYQCFHSYSRSWTLTCSFTGLQTTSPSCFIVLDHTVNHILISPWGKRTADEKHKQDFQLLQVYWLRCLWDWQCKLAGRAVLTMTMSHYKCLAGITLT